MREIDGLKIGFIEHDAYFAGLATPSMSSTAKATGANMVILLAEGKKEADVSDEYLRDLIAEAKSHRASV